MRGFRAMGRLLLGLALVALGAETGARLDDWVHEGTPLLASPERDRDLMVSETWGFRGRPHGQFRKWHLNEFGFRSPHTSVQPPEGSARVLVLGASETFGLYEEKDKEFPAELRRRLADSPFEVVNVAMAGLTIRSMIPYWEHWLKHFRPQAVIVYPTPLFYLDLQPPDPLRDLSLPAEERFRLRMLDRLLDVYRSLPEWLKAWRDEWEIEQQLARRDESWVFRTVPADRLALFEADLERLLHLMRQDGAEPILVTHAHAAHWPIRPDDEPRLRAMRRFFPRATMETLVEFEKKANEVVRRLAEKERIALVDAEAALSGRYELFADLSHFNDDGAAALAELLAEHLTRNPPQRVRTVR